MVVILNLIEKFPIKKNIKLYRTIQNIVNPKKLGQKYIDYTLEDTRIRVFDPKQSSKIIIYIHGGGWVSGNLDTHSNICYELANSLNRKVISIDYRLAPEYPYPAGFNDCYKVISNIMDNISEFSITWNDVILMGDSAGANLAFAVSLRGLYERVFRVGGIVLIYPATQTDYSITTKYKSVLFNDGKGFLTRSHLEDYLSMYLTNPKYYSDKYVNILSAKRLFGLPKIMLVTGTFDPLHDEGVALAKKLKRHLVSVKHYDLKNATHGFFTNVFDKKYTRKTIELIKGFIGDKIE